MEASSENHFVLPTLPDELWINIFDYLAVPDLLNSTLVNKKWNDLISHSARLLDKVIFLFSKSDDEDIDIDNIVELTRKYRYVMILNDEETLDQTDNFPLSINISLVSSFLSDSLIECLLSKLVLTPEELGGIISSCNLLKELRLYAITMEEKNLHPVEVCPSLKSLTIDSTPPHIFDLFKCKKLVELSASKMKEPTAIDHVIKLMNKLGQLDKLHIHTVGLQATVTLQPKFKLSSLSLTIYEFADPANETMMTNFEQLAMCLKLNPDVSFKSQLENVNEETFSRILQKIASIRELSMNPSCFSFTFHSLNKKLDVKRLYVGGIAYGLEGEQQLIPKIPKFLNFVDNIKALEELAVMDVSLLFFSVPLDLSIHFKNLMTLHVSDSKENSLQKLNLMVFPNLQNLSLKLLSQTQRNVANMHMIRDFCSNNKKLTTLKLEIIHWRRSHLMQAEALAMKLWIMFIDTNLERIEIISNVYAEKEKLNFVRTRAEFELKLLGKTLSQETRAAIAGAIL